MPPPKQNRRPVILAVETSCDETACALFAQGRIIGERIYSQRRRHLPFGGVVPELASRDHLRRLLPLIADLLRECGKQPDRIAYTAGPGLAGALLAGATTANALAFAWGIPAVPINHLAGHLLSPRLSRPDFAFPYLSLLVSGGHTQLWAVETARKFRLLGETLDDAAGEAFDKTAVLLGLGYPGGAALEKLAIGGNPQKFVLPSPMQKNFNFSFSGLKSAVRRLVQQELNSAAKRIAKSGESARIAKRKAGESQFAAEIAESAKTAADIAAAFQSAAAEGLAKQTAHALQHTGYSRLSVVGGVAQNNEVWRCIKKYCGGDSQNRAVDSRGGGVGLQNRVSDSRNRAVLDSQKCAAVDLHRPHPAHCGDNAAMIALAASFLPAPKCDYGFNIHPRAQPHPTESPKSQTAVGG